MAEHDKGSDASPPPIGASDPPELARLKARAALLDQQVAIAQDQQKLLSGSLPSDLKLPEGAVAIDGATPIESQVLAHKALDRIARTISERVAQRLPARVLIHNQGDITALLSLQAFGAQLDLIGYQLADEIGQGSEAVEAAEAALAEPQPRGIGWRHRGLNLGANLGIMTMVSPLGAMAAASLGGPLAAPAAAVAAVGSALQLLSLFRVDVSIKYQEIAIADLALAAAVAGHLAGRDPPIEVYDGALVPPNLLETDSPLLDRLGELDTRQTALNAILQRASAAEARLKAAVAALDRRIAAAAKAGEPVAPIEAERASKETALEQLAAAIARMSAAAAAFSTLQTAMLRREDGSGASPLTRVLQAEKLAMIAGDDACFLLLRVGAAGGGVRSKRSFFGSLFSGADLSYSGGAIAHYMLFDPAGRILDGGSIPAYSGFKRVRDAAESSVDLSE